MALTLNLIRTYVRTHLDLDAEDLPDSLLDIWIREGSKRIERAEARWPFYEKIYSWAAAPNPFLLYPKSTIGADLDQVASVAYNTLSHPNLIWIGPEAWQELRATRPAASGRPIYFSEWGGSLVLHPNPDTTYDFLLHGYRKAEDWVAEGTGGVPDFPDELHNTVALWAMSKAYAQQEDPELAALYERQFSDELNEYRRRLVITPHHQPLVLNSGVAAHPTILTRPRFDWELD